jgi:hypothetical protein
MKSNFLAGLLIISLLANLTIGAYSFYNSRQKEYDTCISEKETLTIRIDSLTNKYEKALQEQKYALEVMLNSGLDFQKVMPEYKDMSKEKFIEAIRQKVVEIKLKLRDK